MNACSKLEVRPYRPGDEAAILALFNRVFSREDPGFRPRSMRTWQHLFADNPDGHRVALAFDDDQRVVAQYAAQGRRVRVGQEELNACLAVDSVAEPGSTPGLGRRGPFVQVGELFAEQFGGVEPERDVFVWGLPERAAWRIGRRDLGYETLCNVKWLVLDADRGPAEPDSNLVVVQAADFPDLLDDLFERAAGDHGALCLRDARRLRWRFGGGEPVRIAIARGEHGARGYAVVRPGRLDGHAGLLLCDWLVPASEPSAARALRSWVLGTMRELGLERALCAFPETSCEWLDFQRAGWRVRPSSFRLVAHSWRQDLSVDWLRRNWYWTLADTDLV